MAFLKIQNLIKNDVIVNKALLETKNKQDNNNNKSINNNTALHNNINNKKNNQKEIKDQNEGIRYEFEQTIKYRQKG